MVHIEITKQPFYGTVYWNGNNFIYTPTPGFSGNDVFYYTKVENGITTSNKKYVSTNNEPPIARNITLSADAYYRKTIDIMELVSDETNPFNDLKIISIDNPVIGRIQNNGKSLYYFPIALNTVEHLDYVVSDREYYSTGTLTLSIINGRVELPLENTTFKYRLERNYNTGITIPPSIPKWESAYDTLSTYEDTWTSTDTSKYVSFSNYVESTSTRLNEIYNTIPIYDGLYVAVVANSATWIKDRNGINFVKNNLQNLINTYNILTAKNTVWNNDYNNYSNISSGIDTNVANINSMNSTVASNAATTWDSSELYNVLENNRYDWDTNYNILSTLNKNNEWNNSISATDYITPIISNDSVDFTNIYNIITGNSAVWSNQETENAMTLSSNWDNVYLSYNQYNNLYNILTSNSGLWINDRSKKDLIYNLINSNSANWNTLYDILTGDYGSNWNSFSSLNSVLTSVINYNNSVYNTVTANSALWNDYYLNGVSANLIDAYNNISSLSDSWNNLYNSFTSISTDFYNNLNNFNSFTSLVSSNSSIWNNIINFENSVSLSTINWNSVLSNKNNYDSLYTILCANSSTWYSNVSLLTSISSFIFQNYIGWDTMYSTIVAGDWLNAVNNYDKLSGIIGENNVIFDNLYNTVTANSALWKDGSYLNGVSANLIDAYNNISSLSDSWNNLYNSFTSISTDLYSNLNNSNSFTSLVSSNSSTWNDIINFENSISLSTVNWNEIANSKSDYDSLYTILCANSSTWYSNVSLLTSISSFIINNYETWDTMYSAIVSGDWLNAVNNYDKLSGIIGENNVIFDNLYNTVTANSTKWASVDFYNTKLSAISSWDSLYDTLIIKNNYNSWNNAVTDLSALSSTFYTIASSLNILNSDIQNSLFIWDNKVGSTVLSGNSADWANSYSTVSIYSAGWDFNNKQEYSSTYSYVTANSARLTNTSNNVNTYSSVWDNSTNILTPTLVSQFLTGSETVNLSTFNLSVIGETYIKGNLSALGGRFSIDTTLNTTSGFVINNDNNVNAVDIDKIGGGAIINLYMADSPVLYVKAQPRTVGINLSAISNTIGGVNNISLTVSGNISASGYVYPFPEALTVYTNKSASYESAYTYLTSNSAAIDTFISDTKPVYDSMVSYINAGSISSFSAVTIPYYNNYANRVSDYSNKITQTNNYIALCGNVLDVDNLFATNSSKYEQTYNHVSTVATGGNSVISHYFGHDVVPSLQKINVVVQDNIRIQSWQLYSDNSSLKYNNNLYNRTTGMIIGKNNELSGWGSNGDGQLGIGSITTPILNITKINVPKVRSIIDATSYTMVIGIDNILCAWGYNYYGTVGNNQQGSNTPVTTPIKVNLPTTVLDAFTSGENSFAITKNNDLYGWGQNANYSVGKTGNAIPTPTIILSKVKKVVPVSRTTFAIGLDGSLSGWGSNSYGQLLKTPSQNSLITKLNLSNVEDINSQGTYSHAIGLDGGLSAWGQNNFGQLGTGNTLSADSPVKIDLPPIMSFNSIGNSSYAIGLDGGLSAWGQNNFGRLGTGNTLSAASPVKIDLPPIKKILLGSFSTVIVLGIDGGLSGWGQNNYGQLANGNTLSSLSVVKIDLPPVYDVYTNSGLYYNAIGIDNGLSGWGRNFSNQIGIGDGTTTNILSPVKINISEVTSTLSSIEAYNISVDILSTTHSNFGKVNNPVSITNNNPPTLTISNKNSAANLSSIWTQTYLPKGSVLQFNLINNNNFAVSGLLINLTVQKQ